MRKFITNIGTLTYGRQAGESTVFLSVFAQRVSAVTGLFLNNLIFQFMQKHETQPIPSEEESSEIQRTINNLIVFYDMWEEIHESVDDFFLAFIENISESEQWVYLTNSKPGAMTQKKRALQHCLKQLISYEKKSRNETAANQKEI